VSARKVLKLASLGSAAFLILGAIAPYVRVNFLEARVKRSLERTLGRQVEIGAVAFSLFRGPGFSLNHVIIHEDPSIGLEPIAYVDTLEVSARLWPLLAGHFVPGSIRMMEGDTPTVINISKTGPASEPGRWNFELLLGRPVLNQMPGIHVRNGRINFKFGDLKSVFYLTNTDLDISPPAPGGRAWSVQCSAQPARTDRPAQGLGSFTARGKWRAGPGLLDLDVRLEQTGLGELTALLRGESAGIHGTISSRLRLTGPLNAIAITGRVNIEDVHRWDLLPPKGQGWPLDLRGKLDLKAQRLELESTSPGSVRLPLTARFLATNYLSRPHWGVSLSWNRFPLGPVMELARHMGAQLPPKLKLTGSIDGAIGYSGEGAFQGELQLHNGALTIPDSPPLSFEQAQVVFDHGHARLLRALVSAGNPGQDQAQVEADYALEPGSLDLSISTDAMQVASLRAQVALAAVPWLERVRSGEWSGQLRYHYSPGEKPGWSGRLALDDAEIPVASLASPLELDSVRAQIDGDRVVLSQMVGRAGKLEFSGDYRYEPRSRVPHKLRIRAEAVDGADLEQELMPALRRTGGLIARALGRVPIPDWLKQDVIDGTFEIGEFNLAGERLENLRGRLAWDVTRIDLDSVQAQIDQGLIAGKLAVNLSGSRPAYTLSGQVKGLNWQSGLVDGEVMAETSGIGAQLLTNLSSSGAFTATALDLGTLGPWRSVSGTYKLAWAQTAPRLQFSDLELQTEDETYTGSGATQDDGRLLILLTNGSKEMRMSGTLAKLKVDDTVRP
jgi:hypothetical protein